MLRNVDTEKPVQSTQHIDSSISTSAEIIDNLIDVVSEVKGKDISKEDEVKALKALEIQTKKLDEMEAMNKELRKKLEILQDNHSSLHLSCYLRY